MNEIEFHPFANAFPMMSDQEYVALVADVRGYGQREPITIYQKRILDGRNRERACRELGIKPMYTEFEGTDEEAAAFVFSMNAVRRHLTLGQLAIAAADLTGLLPGQHGDQDQALPIGRAAKIFNVGERSVARARKVKQEGSPDLVEEVRQGKTTLSAAETQIDAQRRGEGVSATPATNGHADPGIAIPAVPGEQSVDIDSEDAGDSEDADDDDENVDDDILDVDLGTAKTNTKSFVGKIISRTGAAFSSSIENSDQDTPLSYRFERPDGSLAKYLPEPQTIGAALQILMHVETVEWRAAFPGEDAWYPLNDLADHVLELMTALSDASRETKTAPAKTGAKVKAKVKAKAKAKPKAKRKT